jgi:hypothetical protein
MYYDGTVLELPFPRASEESQLLEVQPHLLQYINRSHHIPSLDNKYTGVIFSDVEVPC